MAAFLTLLKTGGTLVQLGAPEEDIPVPIGPLLFGNKSITSSVVTSRDRTAEMLQLAADKNITPWVETRPMEEANKAIVDMEDGKARFRYVLTN